MRVNVLRALDADDVRRAARAMVARGVESVAVCYLFSFMNSAHEEETRRILHEAAPGLPVSLSSEVLPRIREWPRLSTTLLNAYLEPVLARYIDHLGKGLDDKRRSSTPRRFLMQSNGGVMLFDAAASGGRTVHTLLSGTGGGGAGERLSRRRRRGSRHARHGRAPARISPSSRVALRSK